MICVSIGKVSVEECVAHLGSLEFAEVRLDTMDVGVRSVTRIFSLPLSLIATCRPGTYSDQVRKNLLMTAIGAGASYVDIETGSPVTFKKDVLAEASRCGSRVIFSYHNFKRTPADGTLKKVIDRSFLSGADMVKIACMVHSNIDNLRLLSLLSMKNHMGKVVIVGMGERGRVTRVTSVLLGSPFTYASIEGCEPMAPGQMEAGRLKRAMELINNE